MLLVGLGLIVLGAGRLVDGASAIARKAGVSEFVIGLTIVGSNMLTRFFEATSLFFRFQPG